MTPLIGAVLALASVLTWPDPRSSLGPATAGPWRGRGVGHCAGRRAGRRAGDAWAARTAGSVRALGEVGRPTVDHVVDAMSLVAMALSGGCAPIDAIEVVTDVSPAWVAQQLRTVTTGLRWGLGPDQCWAQVSPAWNGLARAIDLATEAGVPAAGLILDAAEELRARSDDDLDARVSALGVHLVLPLGLAFLPAFVLTTVVPFVLALVASVFG